MEQFPALLRVHHLRVTHPRRLVFETLANAQSPLTIRSLTSLLPAIDRTSIYRTLETFSKIGLVEVIPVGWKQSYELAEPFKAHHHHLQCTHCGEHIAIDTPRLENMITDIALSHGYQLSRHHIELSGVCHACQGQHSTQLTSPPQVR